MNQTTWGAWYLVATSVKWSTDNSPDKICQDHDAHKQNLLDKIRVRELAIQTDPTKHDIANEKNGTDHTVIWQFVMKICLCYYIYSLDKELKKTANIDNLLISYWSRTKIHKPKSTFGFYQKMKLKITSKKKAVIKNRTSAAQVVKPANFDLCLIAQVCNVYRWTYQLIKQGQNRKFIPKAGTSSPMCSLRKSVSARKRHHRLKPKKLISLLMAVFPLA